MLLRLSLCFRTTTFCDDTDEKKTKTTTTKKKKKKKKKKLSLFASHVCVYIYIEFCISSELEFLNT